MPFRRSGGFTVIELMVVVAVMAILITIALPSFSDTMRTNRVASASNLMMATLAYARSESIRSKTTATVCARTAPDALECGVDWGNGALVWTDDDGDDPSRPEPNEIRRVVDAPNGVTFSGNDGAPISFDARGRVVASGGVERTFVLQANGCRPNSEARRLIRVNPVGQVTIRRENCQ